jgi:hypothetical protein
MQAPFLSPLMPASPAVQSIDPITAKGSAGPTRSSPQPPQAVARSARLEGVGTGEHAYDQGPIALFPHPMSRSVAAGATVLYAVR